MALYGYARVSSTDQDLTVQQDALHAAGCEVIRSEKKSGTTTAGRDELATLLSFMREGDLLVVHRLDRLARSVADLFTMVDVLHKRGAGLRILNAQIDTTTASGRCFLQMLGTFAEFETNLRRERQLEGITKAKAKGVYKGRKPSIEAGKVLELHASGMGATEISRKLGIGRASVYRALSEDVSRPLRRGTLSG